MPPLLVDVPQMIDLALGTPECGAVNFNILHSLLHIMAQQMNLDKCRVEFRGAESSKIENLVRTMPAQKELSILEFDLQEERDEQNHVTTKRVPIQRRESEGVEKVIVIRKIDEADDVNASTVTLSRSKRSHPGFPPQPVKAPSADDFRKLSTTGDSIHDVLGNVVPENQALLDSGRGSDGNPINDMWQLLNLTKRVDATEVGIEKLTSLMRDLSEQCRRMEKLVQKPVESEEVASLADKVDNLGKILHDKVSVMSLHSSHSQETDKPTSQTEADALKFTSGSTNEVSMMKREIENLKKAVRELKSTHEQSAVSANKSKSALGIEDASLRPDSSAVESKLSKYELKVRTIERNVSELQRDLSEHLEAAEDLTTPQPFHSDPTGVADLYAQLNGIKNDLDKNIDRCNHIVSENEAIAGNLQVLSKQTEDLRKLKIDKEEIDELLAEKADYHMLQRKVSLDQFDATRRDITINIEELLGKVREYETSLHAALEEIQTSLDNKLDKEDLDPLKEYFDTKMQNIQNRLKALAALRREPEAAGTKIKFLRDVSCISCNQNVLMRVAEDSSLPKQDGIPDQRSLKPFLTYELDMLRQKMRDIKNTKDLNLLEALMRHSSVDDAGTQPHLSARYCGGSHTVITPQARVASAKLNKAFTKRGTNLGYTARNDGQETKRPKCPCSPKSCQHSRPATQRETRAESV